MERHSLRGWGWHLDLIPARFPGRATKRLMSVVIAWWLLIFWAVAFMSPSTPTGDGVLALAPGDLAHVSTPSGGAWLIPIDRVTYYEVAWPSADDNVEDVPADVGARPGWLIVRDGQAVRVVDIDRAAGQVELVEEPNIGGQGWLHLQYLRP
jgi:hypothetical protein